MVSFSQELWEISECCQLTQDALSFAELKYENVPSHKMSASVSIVSNCTKLVVNVNMRFIVPPLLKEHGCIT